MCIILTEDIFQDVVFESPVRVPGVIKNMKQISACRIRVLKVWPGVGSAPRETKVCTLGDSKIG